MPAWRRIFASKSRQTLTQAQSKQDPTFKHFLQFFATAFERVRISIDALKSGNFTVIGAVRQNFVKRAMHGRADVCGQHERSYSNRVTITLPFCPPKPKAFDMAARTSTLRAAFGT